MTYMKHFELLDARDLEVRHSLMELMLETKEKHGLAWSDLDLQELSTEGKTAKKYLTTDFLLQGEALTSRTVRIVLSLLDKLSLSEQAVLDFHALRIHEQQLNEQEASKVSMENQPVINIQTVTGGNFGTIQNAEGANFGVSVSGDYHNHTPRDK